jgi:hypothetical protein
MNVFTDTNCQDTIHLYGSCQVGLITIPIACRELSHSGPGYSLE